GLAISKNLAQLMGGDIFVESELGKGTIFKVKIPLYIYTGFGKSPETDYNKEPIETFDFSKKKILIVEDHHLNVLVAKKLLEFKKATVEVAENGAAGLAMFVNAPEHTYDAILMDIRMPVMDGLQATKSIRALDSEWAKKVPIIAMSANAFDEDVDKSKKAGMNAHLAKPIDSELLYNTLYELMSKEGDFDNG
ncbi:MAG: response regulator, partial [Oscillospiraceae bacterium]